MGRGFLAGIFWGGLIGLFLIVLSNQVMDRRVLSFPQPEAEPVEVPAGTEFDQARPETDPVVPEAETRPEAEAVVGVQAPEDMVETPPSFDTSSLEVPTPAIESPGTLGEAPEPAAEPEIGVTGPDDSAVVEERPTLPAPDAPTSAPETTSEAPAAVAAPEAAEEPVVEAPEAQTAPEVQAQESEPPVTVATPEPAPQAREDTASAPEPAAAPEAALAPEVADAPSGVTLPDTGAEDVAILRPGTGEPEVFKPLDGLTDRAPQVETDRLPRVEPEAEPVAEEFEAAPEVTAPETGSGTLPTIRRLPGQVDEEPPAVVTEEAAPESPPTTGRAIADWSMPFDNPGDLPLVSIVLVHEAGADAATVARALPETVAIGVRAGDADAAAVARAYRAAGREVVLIPSLPADASPQDVEVALQANFATIPEAVAVMDSTGETFQADRNAVAQVVDVIAATGHGLITFPRGLNTALQQAERSDVPAGLVFRDIDGTGQDAGAIQRALDRAAFRAGRGEAIILVGRTGANTLSAIGEWTLGSRAETITLAPVSRALVVGGL